MLILRKIDPSDLNLLYDWENDSSSWADGDTHNPLSHQDLSDYLAATTGDCFRDGQLRMVAESDGEAVGCVDLYDLDARNRKAGVGIYIAPAYRDRGLAAEALRQLHTLAFTHLGLEMLYAFVSVDNAQSSALFRSLGYHPSSPLPRWTLESDAVIWQVWVSKNK